MNMASISMSKHSFMTHVSAMSIARKASVAFRGTKGGFQVPKYQNNYRLESYNPWKVNIADKVLKQVMDLMLQNVTYDPDLSPKYAANIATEVRLRLYKKDFDRYKFVVLVSIYEKLDQGIYASVGRLWDGERDTYSHYNYENNSLYATGTIFALYYE